MLGTYVQVDMVFGSKQHMRAHPLRCRKVAAGYDQSYEARCRVLNSKVLYLVIRGLQLKKDTSERPPINCHAIRPLPMGRHSLIPQYFRSNIWRST
jgi:hypothetical protein